MGQGYGEKHYWLGGSLKLYLPVRDTSPVFLEVNRIAFNYEKL